MEITQGPLLRQINSPGDLKKLEERQLPQVCTELRQYIIDVVSTYGGHFAASLGVVELTVALHYVFNTPYDQVVWDVGHQAYGHKILTGRRDQFVTNRKYGGVSGFPKRSESKYDAFGAGHSSTSISAALGMAIASKYKGEANRHHIAVIGDGALSAGMSFEALNNAGTLKSNLLIVLNDNSISIDPNVSALEKYLTKISLPGRDEKTDKKFWKLIGKRGSEAFSEAETEKIESALNDIVNRNGNLFQSLGIQYSGPIDGNNIGALVDTLSTLKDIEGPKLLHIKTVKGKGYAPAEKDQTKWHSTGAFDKITGKTYQKKAAEPLAPKYQEVFGETLIELAEKNEKIIAVTPAMPTGSGLKTMMEKMPGRAFDVGICEQHAVTFSAGMAANGLKVFCTIYSTFMQRAYDQVIHDVAIQDLPVIFCLDRAGLVGEDGPTHHGVFDIAFMRCVPNMIVCAPMNEQELRNMMYTAQLDSTNHPFVIRYPRGRGVLPEWRTPFERISIGTGVRVQQGKEIAILSYGHPGNFVMDAIAIVQQRGVNPAHYNMRFVKPLDTGLLHEVFTTYRKVITVEDGAVNGGFGSAVLEFMNANHYAAQVRMIGVPDHFIEHGTPEQLYDEVGLSAHKIAQAIIEETKT